MVRGLQCGCWKINRYCQNKYRVRSPPQWCAQKSNLKWPQIQLSTVSSSHLINVFDAQLYAFMNENSRVRESSGSNFHHVSIFRFFDASSLTITRYSLTCKSERGGSRFGVELLEFVAECCNLGEFRECLVGYVISGILFASANRCLGGWRLGDV